MCRQGYGSISRRTQMSKRYPQPGEKYESVLYPGQLCEVLSVVEAQVTFRWLPPYKYIDEQIVPVNQFIEDFSTTS